MDVQQTAGRATSDASTMRHQHRGSIRQQAGAAVAAVLQRGVAAAAVHLRGAVQEVLHRQGDGSAGIARAHGTRAPQTARSCVCAVALARITRAESAIFVTVRGQRSWDASHDCRRFWNKTSE